jgi:hypothetical protein
MQTTRLTHPMRIAAGLALAALCVNVLAWAATEDAINSYFGVGAGGPAGNNNSFFGVNAGDANTGHGNAFFGENTGKVNAGTENSFFGAYAGQSNSTGSNNAFFGYAAGFNNISGAYNSAFGAFAGQSTTAGGNNAFFGYAAGSTNVSGDRNAFFGANAGANSTGDDNAFFGNDAGYNNTGFDNNFFGTEVGYNTTFGAHNAFFGPRAGYSNTEGYNNSFFGREAGYGNISGGKNAFFGISAGKSNTTGSNNTYIGPASDGTADLSNATALGNLAFVSQSNSVVLGSINGVNGAAVTARVGLGTPTPTKQLHVKGDSTGANSNNQTAIRVENVSATAAARRMLELVNNGDSAIAFTNSNDPTSVWSLQNYGTEFLMQRNGNIPFRLSSDGRLLARNGAAPYHFNLSPNGNLAITGVLTQGSDVNSKKDIVALDGNEVLARLDTLPISEWIYKTDEANARHAGPMAQDFQSAFGLGDDPTRLAPGDVAGVALAAVKQLRSENADLRAALAASVAGQAQLRQEMTAMLARMNRVEEVAGVAAADTLARAP